MRIDLPDPNVFHKMLETETKHTYSTVATGVVTDSREVKTGDLFVAIKGNRVDGHDFIAQAKENECVAALVTTLNPDVDIPQIKVDDPVVVISNLAKKWRANFVIPILGITGSNGKTTTKDLLIHVFSASQPIHGTRGNYNTHLGLPLTLLELTSHHTLSFLEMGANQPGDIGYLCNIAKPQYGLITNIAPAHLQYFGSIENVVKTKGELYTSLPPNGIAFKNSDDTRISSLPTNAQIISYGFNTECDFSADLHRDEKGLLSLTINGYEIELNSHNEMFAKNVVAACAVSVTLNIDWDTIQNRILSFKPTEGRCDLKQFKGVTIIDDTYNANLESSIAAINFLCSLPTKSKRIVVFGDMLELGTVSESHHRAVGKKCVASGVDALLCFGEESKATVAAANSHISTNHYKNKNELISDLQNIIKTGDVILFKGSRGMAMESIIKEVFEK